MFAVLLTGPPGSGKTSVLTALQNMLADDGVRHAAIEVEALAWAHPPVSDEQSFSHVAALRDLYASVGYDLILCAATVTSDSYMTALIAALAPDAKLVVRLDAAVTTLRERIEEREPAEWSGLTELLEAAENIASVSRLLANVDATYSTEGASARAIAADIRDALPVHRTP